MKKFFSLCAVVAFIVGCGAKQNNPTSEVAPGISSQQHVSEGIKSLKEANPRDAIKNFDEAIRQNPMDPSAYIVLGETYLRLNRYDRAVDTFTAGTRVAPNEGHLYYLLAISYGLSGKPSEAKINAEKSYVLFQRNKDVESLRKSVALLKSLSDSNSDPTLDPKSDSKPKTKSVTKLNTK